MPRGRKKKNDQRELFDNKLLNEFKFLSIAQQKKGTEVQTHSMMNRGYATAFDGVIAVGTKVSNDLYAAPNTYQMILALEQVTEGYKIVQDSRQSLQIDAGAFVGQVDCIPFEKGVLVRPDEPVCSVPDAVSIAIQTCSIATSNKAETVLQGSIQLSSNSAIATDRSLIIEYWHGAQFPRTFLIPKAAGDALNKIRRVLTSIGWSEETITFWFEGYDSWMRTNVYNEDVPNIRQYLDAHIANAVPIPPEIFQATKTIGKLSTDGRLYYGEDWIGSDNGKMDSKGVIKLASHNRYPRSYLIKDLVRINGLATSWDQNAFKNGTLWFGDKSRGALTNEEFDDIPF